MPAQEESTANLQTTVGAHLISSIAAEVMERARRNTAADYNERYIDGGPAWQEHINYNDGGQHGETHRPN